MSNDWKGWLLLTVLYSSDLAIKIFEKEMFCASWGMQVPCYSLEITHHQEAQRMLFPENKQILPKYQKGF